MFGDDSEARVISTQLAPPLGLLCQLAATPDETAKKASFDPEFTKRPQPKVQTPAALQV